MGDRRGSPESTTNRRVIIVCGVSGSGKTVVGRELARRLGGRFFDADEFHSAENIAKMSAGVPLTDEDRRPWLERMRREVVEAAPPGETWVLACSALTSAYREFLRRPDEPDVRLVFLDGTYEVIYPRMAARRGHFMREQMLRSQFAILERPASDEAIIVDVDASPEAVVDEIVRRLS